MTKMEIFAWGLSGSLAVDVVTAAQFCNSAQINFPDRYKRFAFYMVRFLLALVAGGLAVAYEIDKAILAANIGAATPLIIQAFAQGLGNVPAISTQTPVVDTPTQSPNG
ncbi:hypothetical protein [Andreprevotia chitinilytica]|uniref:hypothetical protein n=1 Tax=Andreprevotia chitinilytica TaxID=396808 RepID=UPI0012EC6D74|nr:hypothetical protein [Andreprevotia chitinilytica]